MSIYDLVPGHLPVVYSASLLAAALLVLAGLSVKRKIEAGGVVPDRGITLRNVFEAIVEYLLDMADATMGHEGRKYLGVVCSIFFFILIANLMGLVPLVGGATSYVEAACAWAIIAFLVYNFVGIKTHGWKYVYQFMGPSLLDLHVGGRKFHVRALAPLFLPLELLLHGARILTLTVRLLANMFADHTVVGVWISMVPIAVPAIFMGLGTLVAFLQAFVFALLTMIYIGSALEEAH
ncbi:MAG: F0F1 ATP synthase subunit A [Myxococcota bacterium]|nr:F0F1 ATP synthase subunit A [Myxococcales bacterium]